MKQPAAHCTDDTLQSSQTECCTQGKCLPPRPVAEVLKSIFGIDIAAASFLNDIRYQKQGLIAPEDMQFYPVERIHKYVSPSFDCLLWKVPVPEYSNAYFFLLLEFLAEDNREIPLKFLEYTSDIVHHCLDNNMLVGEEELLPPIDPVAVHIGKDTWKTCFDIFDMSRGPKELEKYALHTAYSLVDVQDKKMRAKNKESDIVRTDCLAFQILALAGCQSLDALEEAAPRMLAAVRDIPQPEKRSDLSAFLAEAVRSLLYSFGLKDAPRCKNLEEAVPELAQNAQVWRRRLG